MSGPTTGTATSLEPGFELVPLRRLVEPGIEAWFQVWPGDRLLVAAGDEVHAGAPLVVRLRDQEIREVRAPRAAAAAALRPGAAWSSDPGPGRRADGDRAGEHLFELGGRWSVVSGEPAERLESPLDGTVVDARPGAGIRLRAPAPAVRGIAAVGGPVRGRLQVATSAGGELRAPAIDVGRSGQVLVVGARIDAEALTRARAMGVRGIIVGGLPSKERRDFLASEVRQRAARQRLPAFAILVMEGSVRRPIASPVMAILEALDGHEVAILADPPALAVWGPIRWPEPPAADLVRVRSGPLLGREGRWAGLAGLRRFPGGVALEAGLVHLDGEPTVAIPIGDLERFA
jgi:hypothetical protein